MDDRRMVTWPQMGVVLVLLSATIGYLFNISIATGAKLDAYKDDMFREIISIKESTSRTETKVDLIYDIFNSYKPE